MAKNWAIVIGINQYDNLKALDYAKRDAEAMRDFFLHDAGFQQVYCFTDDSPPIPTDSGPALRSQPTFGTLSRFLRTQFEHPFLEPGDNLWFFFAGHGQLHQNRDYLMPIDVDPGDIDRTAIPITYVSERLRRCGANNVILMLDACRNESGRDGLGIGTETQQGVITFFACSPKERSYELETLQQGAFTHALLEALSIRGAGNCATVERLYQHLRYRVPPLVQQAHKRTQTPYAKVEPATKLHLILLPQAATDADVLALKNDALQAEAEGRLEAADHLWVRVLAIRAVDRQALEGIKRIARKLVAPSFPYALQSGNANDSAQGTPSPITSPTQPPITPAKRQRLETQRADLQSTWNRQMELLTQLRQALVIETSASNKFQLQQQVQTAETELAALADKLDNLEQELNPPNQGTDPSSDTRSAQPPISPPPHPHLERDSETQNSKLKTQNFEIVTTNDQGKVIQKQQRQAQYQRVDMGKGIFLDMVRIPGGSFDMGSNEYNDEKPIHRVTVPAFFMAKTPITQAQYQAIMGENPSDFKGENRPVECITWHQALAFCQKLSQKTGQNYRLPSEAEWEYACRGEGPLAPTQSSHPFYFGPTITPDLVNYDGNYPYGNAPKGQYREQTSVVGSFPPNAFGLYDLHGNVWEWCADNWHPNYGSAPTDGSIWKTKDFDNDPHVMRGGSWLNRAVHCRAAYRSRCDPDDSYYLIGFRVVCASAART